MAVLAMPVMAGADEPPKKGADLQGTWQGVEVWDAGKKRASEPAKLLTIKFQDDRFEVRYDSEKMLLGRFSVDHGKAPARLTLNAVAQDGEPSTIPAIYRIEDGKLSLCHPNNKGGERPSEFKPSKDVVLAILAKQK